MVDRKLGRGLDFLIKKTVASDGNKEVAGVDRDGETPGLDIAIDSIVPNPYQPRRHFDIEALNDLIESIRHHGVLQPISVRRQGDRFELIAGERRWRACQELGLTSIPAVVHDVDAQKMLELALIENIQREDLDPLEKARAYRRLIDEFSITQDEAARRLGQKRSTVANFLRLLELEEGIQARVARGTISMGHARALLAVPRGERADLARQVEEGALTVRQLEAIGQRRRQESSSAATPVAQRPDRAALQLAELEGRLREALGTKVQLKGSGRRGKIVIEYFDEASLDRLLNQLEDSGRSNSANS